MEPLWSPVVATGGNQRQIGCARKRRKQAKTVAVGCDRLRAKYMVRRGSIRGVRCCPKWRTTGAHPSLCTALLPNLGYANRRSFVSTHFETHFEYHGSTTGPFALPDEKTKAPRLAGLLTVVGAGFEPA